MCSLQMSLPSHMDCLPLLIFFIDYLQHLVHFGLKCYPGLELKGIHHNLFIHSNEHSCMCDGHCYLSTHLLMSHGGVPWQSKALSESSLSVLHFAC